jgi:hypothetical protein
MKSFGVDGKKGEGSFKLETAKIQGAGRLCFWKWSLEVGLQLLSLCLIFFRCADLAVLGLQSLQGISM